MNCLLKFSAINLYFHNLLESGENSFCSKNVTRVDFDPQLLMIRAKVKTSMKAKVYNVNIYLTNDCNIEKANCECPRGLEICHHIAVAMFASRYELSKTDVACSWAPSPSTDENVKTWKELYNIAKPKRISQRDHSDHEVAQFAEDIRNEICCGFGWILKDEPENLDSEIAMDINLLLLSDGYETAENPINWLEDKIKVNQDQIRLIAAATIGQHSNIDWINARRFRITASNFGALIGCITRNRYPPSLYNRLLGQQNLDGIKAIQWGKTHEVDGIKVLERYLEEKVVRTGLWLSESGILGASPDGIIHESVIEVKCRYKSRASSLSADLAIDKSYIIWYNTTSNVWVVNEDHEYFHQIQGQIYLTSSKGCFLVVWTPIESAIVYIEKNHPGLVGYKKWKNFTWKSLFHF